MLQAPPPTPYDLNFNCLGFPVRISSWFWLGAVLFGFSFTRSLDQRFAESSPGQLPLMLVWTACLLLSILIHELGHALAFRRYGIESSIVLYHFGGLAIPNHSSFGGASSGDLTPKQDMWVSFAGPLLQIASAVVITAVVKALGYGLSYTDDEWVYSMNLWPIDLIPGFVDGEPLDSPGLYALLTFYLVPSFLWSLLNLVPVFPLDGGQICQSIVEIQGRPRTLSLQISLATAAIIAAYGFTNGQTYLGFMFAMLGITNYQLLQQYGRF